ncbi:MAG: T9SS type A sorting domain-containing protein [Calditrichia bacterium]
MHRKFAALQNYSNPFNPNTIITFTFAESAKSLLTVYNMLGQAVQVLVDETLAPGEYRVTWEGVNDYGETMPSGIYFYELRANEFVQIRKMILLH